MFYFVCEWHLLFLKLIETFQGEKGLPKNETFGSQDAKLYVNV